MPKNKDLKRLVRARMAKTGESYTAARAHITGAAPRAEGPQTSWPELAGMADEAVRAKTERTWAEWVAALDAIGATEMSHTEIARYVRDELDVDGWWAQTVTVGYERIRGLRAKHQMRSGEFQASKSKTFSVPIGELYAAFADGRRRARWLGDAGLSVRNARPDKTVRFDAPDATRVAAAFTDKGPRKSTVTVTCTKLASAEAVTDAKAEWHERLKKLAQTLKA